jgi:hypothetical protein
MTKPQFLQNDVANLLAHIDGLLTAYPELADDAELRADMLEGSTAAFDVLTRLVNIERDADSMAKAVAERIQALQARKAVAERRKEAMRVLMLRIMRAGGIQKAPLVEATVSVGKGRDSVDITDEQRLPKWAVKVVKQPDKKAIMERLADNKNVPGAALKTGEDTVVVRVV